MRRRGGRGYVRREARRGRRARELPRECTRGPRRSTTPSSPMRSLRSSTRRRQRSIPSTCFACGRIARLLPPHRRAEARRRLAELDPPGAEPEAQLAREIALQLASPAVPPPPPRPRRARHARARTRRPEAIRDVTRRWKLALDIAVTVPDLVDMHSILPLTRVLDPEVRARAHAVLARLGHPAPVAPVFDAAAAHRLDDGELVRRLDTVHVDRPRHARRRARPPQAPRRAPGDRRPRATPRSRRRRPASASSSTIAACSRRRCRSSRARRMPRSARSSIGWRSIRTARCRSSRRSGITSVTTTRRSTEARSRSRLLDRARSRRARRQRRARHAARRAARRRTHGAAAARGSQALDRCAARPRAVSRRRRCGRTDHAPIGGAPLRETSGAPVIIVGAGPAGMFCAYELARAGVRAIVDRSRQERARSPQGSQRPDPARPRRYRLELLLRRRRRRHVLRRQALHALAQARRRARRDRDPRDPRRARADPRRRAPAHRLEQAAESDHRACAKSSRASARRCASVRARPS